MDNQGHGNPTVEQWWKGPMRAVVLFLAFTFGLIVHFNQTKGTVKKGYWGYVLYILLM